MMQKISFAIPCYGSENTIKKVIDEIIETISKKSEYDYEIICVNDCSPDNVWEVLKKLAEENHRIKLINLAKNRGKQSAQMAAYANVTGDIIVNLDDDGQCPMDRLWDLIEPLYNGYDVSYAKYPKKMQSRFKNFGSRINAIMNDYLLSKPKSLQISNFSAVKRFVINEIIKYNNPYPYISGLYLRTTSKIANVEMSERNRYAGTGNFTFKKSLSLFLNGATAFSVVPLRMASVAGVVCALIGFIFAIYTIINKIINPSVLMGYSSTMAVLLIIGGIIMVLLGIIGEYIGRIYICLNNSPQYVIREVKNIGINEDEN